MAGPLITGLAILRIVWLIFLIWASVYFKSWIIGLFVVAYIVYIMIKYKRKG